MPMIPRSLRGISMRYFKEITIKAPTVALAVLCAATAVASEPISKPIADALRWVERPPVEFTRDAVYKPGEILALTGIKPGMVAVDLMPDSGYYMRILSSVVGERGHVYAVIPQSNGQG